MGKVTGPELWTEYPDQLEDDTCRAGKPEMIIGETQPWVNNQNQTMIPYHVAACTHEENHVTSILYCVC